MEDGPTVRGRPVTTDIADATPLIDLAAIGAVGVLMQAKRRGLIAALRPELDQLGACGFPLTNRVYRACLAVSGESARGTHRHGKRLRRMNRPSDRARPRRMERSLRGRDDARRRGTLDKGRHRPSRPSATLGLSRGLGHRWLKTARLFFCCRQCDKRSRNPSLLLR
jgi:Domain of unknown function (DUF3368)